MYANALNESSFGAKLSNSEAVDNRKEGDLNLVESVVDCKKISLYDNLDKGVERTIWFLYEKVGFDGLKIYEDGNGDEDGNQRFDGSLDDGLDKVIENEFDCVDSKRASVALLRSVYHCFRNSRILLVNEERLNYDEKLIAQSKKKKRMRADSNLRYGDLPEYVGLGKQPVVSYQFALKLDMYPEQVIDSVVGVILENHGTYLKCRIKGVQFERDL
jgi:hypothetical protein